MPKPKEKPAQSRQKQAWAVTKRASANEGAMSRLDYELAINALNCPDGVFTSMIAASYARIQKGWMSVRDACTFLLVSEDTFRKLVKRHGLMAYKPEYSATPMYRTSDIEAILEPRPAKHSAA